MTASRGRPNQGPCQHHRCNKEAEPAGHRGEENPHSAQTQDDDEENVASHRGQDGCQAEECPPPHPQRSLGRTGQYRIDDIPKTISPPPSWSNQV
jgi:hypothetical protein